MNPILIGGTGRSGTSVLKRVIAGHHDVASIPGEMRIIVDPGGLLDLHMALTKRWSPYAADIALQRLESLLNQTRSCNKLTIGLARVMQKLGMSPPRYGAVGLGKSFGNNYYKERSQRLIADLSLATNKNIWAGTPAFQVPGRMIDTPWPQPVPVPKILAQFVEDLFSHVPGPNSRSHWVEDTPYNLLHVDQLLVLFPNLRFVHVYRDFRDVVASYRVQRWGGGDLAAISQRVRSIMNRWQVLRASLPAKNIVEIRLESVVDSPEDFFAQLLEFTELPDSDSMRHNLAEVAPNRLHAGRWKKDLSVRDQEIVKSYLDETLAAYGYN